MSGLGALRLTSFARVLGERGPSPGGLPAGVPGATVPEGIGAGLTIAGALDRARASGHPATVVGALARHLSTLAPVERTRVLDPLGRAAALARDDGPTIRPLLIGDVRARQVDGTTCGSAVLAILAAAGDPVLALWLATGSRVGGPDAAPAPAPEREAGARWRHLQRVVKARTARRALGPFPWPAALGTPPWGAARVARYAGTRFTHRVVDGASAAAVVGAAVASAAAGVPVPLFTGGDLSGGVAAAVPRHVVLLVAADPHQGPEAPASTPPEARRCWVYEPSSGTVHRLDAAALLRADDVEVRRALGGWPHVVWAVLPR